MERKSHWILSLLVYGLGVHASACLWTSLGVHALACLGNLKVELQTKVSFSPATPMPELESLFQCTEGWTGADGNYSVPLSATRTLWLYGDTWVGKIVDGKRVPETMVNSTVALQEGRGKDARVRFFIQRNKEGKPTALLTPSDGHGWYWLQAGILAEKQLLLFLAQIEKTDDPGVFGFRQIGKWLGVVDHPEDEPTSWHIQQLKIPWTLITSERDLAFGTAVMEASGYLYIYGTDEDLQGPDRARYLVAARAPVNSVTDFNSWRFYHEGEWVADFRMCSRLIKGMGSEGSVSFLPKFGCYVLVYTEGGLSSKILARTAPHPWGPWSEAATVYECPDVQIGKDVFCYAAKAHPQLGGPEELIITYAANSFDFSQVVNDARLYWPRFVRVIINAE